MSKTIVIFDTETTGLIKPSVVDIKEQPQIIEFFGYKVERTGSELKIVDQFHQYYKPEKPIDDFITKITGISDKTVEHSPSFLDVFHNFSAFHVGVEEWVAHNCAFDAAMVANEVSRIGKIIHFPFPPKHSCTVKATMQFEQRRLTLTNLHKYLFGVGFEDAHSAKGDVDALFRCYTELVQRGVM